MSFLEFFLNWNPAYTTGIVIREEDKTNAKITLVNRGTSEKSNKFTVKVFDWSDETPKIIFSETYSLKKNSCEIIDIPLYCGVYGDDIDIKLFEVQVAPKVDAVLVNLFQTNELTCD